MLHRRAAERIRQYLCFLDERKYRFLEPLRFEVAETEESRRAIPEDLSWVPIELPHAYGREWTCYWFRTEVTVPHEAEGTELFLAADTGSDTLVYLDGVPDAAINSFHRRVRLFEQARAGDRLDLALECYGGHRYPGTAPLDETRIIVTLQIQAPHYPLWFRSAGLCIKRPSVYALYYDGSVLLETALELDETSLRRHRILAGLYDALLSIYFTAEEDELERQATNARARIASLLELPNQTAPTLFAVGHAHIDHAWLWSIDETRRKIARTFANMARYAREYPEFRFIQSMPAQLEQLRDDYPAIFERIRDRFEAGQWEPNGGMYIEADSNLPSCESLIRQFLIGKQVSSELLGYEGDTLWLPDVFGYPAVLPQIMQGCEVSYFVTSKIHWNDTTRFPYDTFLWIGSDGSEVATSFISQEGYNGTLTPAENARAWKSIQHKEVQDALIKPVGEGNGGGGTLRSDLERARRLRDLEGTPRVEWSTVSNGLKHLFSTAGTLPSWQGELYLEQHRGTYTTQAALKRSNRECELLLRDVELIRSLLTLCAADAPYPGDALQRAWKQLLINQFHDILPGSSIERVNREARELYRELRATLTELRTDGIRRLAAALARRRYGRGRFSG